MPNIGDIYRAIVKGRILGTVETRNMFGYVLTSANATETEIAVALEGAVEGMFDAFKVHFWSGYQIFGSETQKWYPAIGQTPGYWLGYHSHNASITGTGSGDLVSFQSAALLVFKTGVKRVLGRKFIAGMIESETAQGSWTSAAINPLVTFVASMLASVTFGTGGVAQPGVLDKTGAFHQYTTGTVGSIISTMRRRKPGYGI